MPVQLEDVDEDEDEDEPLAPRFVRVPDGLAPGDQNAKTIGRGRHGRQRAPGSRGCHSFTGAGHET